MDLLIDNKFRDSYTLYYGQSKDEVVLEEINKLFSIFNPEVIMEAINIIKTAAVLSFTYSDCYEIVYKKIFKKFPIQHDIDRFILSMVVKVLISSSENSIIINLLKSSRDINKEVTAKHFRVPLNKVTTSMVDDLLWSSAKFRKKAYSVEEPVTNGWDEYFYNVCQQVARNSKCLSRKIGSVLVRDKSIIGTGYNGPPRGVPRCDLRWVIDDKFAQKYKHKIGESKVTTEKCPRKVIGFKTGEGLGVCVAGHAERNALINAARNGIGTMNTSLYMTCGIPCTPCLIEIINAGVKEIVVASLDTYDESSMYLLEQSSLGVRLFDFIE